MLTLTLRAMASSSPKEGRNHSQDDSTLVRNREMMHSIVLGVGDQWLSSTKGSIKTPAQLNGQPVNAVSFLVLEVPKLKVASHSETRWVGSSLMSHLFTPPRISEQAHAGV